MRTLSKTLHRVEKVFHSPERGMQSAVSSKESFLENSFLYDFLAKLAFARYNDEVYCL